MTGMNDLFFVTGFNLRSRIRSTTILGIALVLITLASLSGSSYFTQTLIRREVRKALVQRNALLAKTIAHETESLLNSYTKALMMLKEAAMQERTTIAIVEKNFPAFDRILVLNGDGIVSAWSENSAEGGFDLSRRDFFLIPKATGKPYMSSTFISTATYEPTAVLSVPYERGVIAGYLNLKSLAEYISSLSSGDETISLLDRDGYFVAHAALSDVYSRVTAALDPWYLAIKAGEPNPIEKSIESGSENIVSWAPIAYGQWLVVVSQNTKTLFSGEKSIILASVFFIFVSVFVSLIVIFLVIRLITNDLTALSERTRIIAEGNYEAQPIYRGFLDFQVLSENFEKMRKTIKERENSLKDEKDKTTANLREKEVLLKEIHHRVKNNLQLVSSLLALRSAYDQDGKDVFNDSIDRIQVMAMIHEMLYQSKDFSFVDAQNYIGTIVNWLSSSYATDVHPQLSVDIEALRFDIDTAIPCGLVINELVTNSMKYAFRDGCKDSPKILVSIKKDENGFVMLIVSDNGSGVPPHIDPIKSTTLGMQLVTSLSEQLHGTWELERDRGTVWRIRFPYIEVDQINTGGDQE